MKKSLTFSFAMLLGVVVLLSPVSNALEADMSSSITYRPEDTQICYVSEIDEVISNTEIDRSVRQTVKERARTGAIFLLYNTRIAGADRAAVRRSFCGKRFAGYHGA